MLEFWLCPKERRFVAAGIRLELAWLCGRRFGFTTDLAPAQSTAHPRASAA